ncbi:MAG: CBS domain-containing protein, partial [Pedobacter sp.]
VAYTANNLGIAHLNVANFIVAGMAASLAGIMHAPLTGIFLIAEITGGYALMVPLMITAAISYLINRSSNKYSIYTKPLAEKGELLSHEDKDTTVLNMMKLKYLVEDDYLVLSPGQLVSSQMDWILLSKRNIFPVVDHEGKFHGLIYIEDILRSRSTEEHGVLVDDLMQPAPAAASVNDSLKEVLKIMEKESIWVLPVFTESGSYLGFVSKTAIFTKYRALLKRQADYLA